MNFSKKEYGNSGEEKIIDYLNDLSWKILEKNYFSKFGEIDIIAKKESIIIFVEVKTRKKSYLSAADLIPPKKRKNIITTAEIYISKNNIDLNENLIRFDLAYLENDKIFYYENAFQK